MKYSGRDFKEFYKRVVAIELNEDIRRLIAKGHYVKHRVFFKDEETAIAAGYRPCKICMPERYKEY